FSWFANRLKLPSAGHTELRGATGSTDSVLLHVAALSVDGHEIQNFSADAMPDRPDGAKLGGVVGVDLMTDRRVSLDYSGRRFWIARSKCSSPVDPHRGGHIK
ncbi:MAG TPA: hypothetical protein VIJ53_00275, partial [Acidobacteriaceae bacterium]